MGSSVDDLTAASSTAGGTGSLIGDWIESSCEAGSGVTGSTGVPRGLAASGTAPGTFSDVVPDDVIDDGLPGVPALSGLFSLMTVRQAPSTRTNEYALIIRQHATPGKLAHNCSHCWPFARHPT
jgi:hypothetical protein